MKREFPEPDEPPANDWMGAMWRHIDDPTVREAESQLPDTLPPDQGGQGGQGQTGERPVYDEGTTHDLPPSYTPPPLPKRIPMLPDAQRRRLIIIGSAVLAVIVVIGSVAWALRPQQHALKGQHYGANCVQGSPCQAAGAYLDAYTGVNFEGAYALTSSASRQKFSAPTLRGTYKDAHDYIVNRTKGLLDAADVYSIAATPGSTALVNDTTASEPVHLIYKSHILGEISQDLTLPLTLEAGKWKITWTPGLVFSKLDDSADPNYQRKLHLYASSGKRGTIFDRDGNFLAHDEMVFDVGVIPAQLKDENASVATLSANLGLTTDQVKAKYQGKDPNGFALLRTISQAQYTKIQPALSNLSGVQARQDTGRVYPYGADTAAVTGYVQQVSADDLKNDTSGYYAEGDVIGRAGVEAWGEQYLRPTKGGRLQIVNANADGSYGQPVYSIAQSQASDGQDIHTTISLADQQIAMANMRAQDKGPGGGTFAVNPTTGEVLVLASTPIYDPNDFSLDFQPGIAALDKMNSPYVNRAVGSAASIGSVFKLVTLGAALENGISDKQVFTCTGSYQVPGEDKPRPDDTPQGHGTLTAVDAIAPSCTVIPWQISVILNGKDPNILPNMARGFGYGASTAVVGLPSGEEISGTLPDPAWLKKNKNANWSITDAANLAVGQGFFAATPAQVTMATAAMANGGVRMQPRLVSSVNQPGGAPVKTFDPQTVGKLPVTPEHLADLQTAMFGVTQTPSGTAYSTWHTLPVIAVGKTGTAESGQPKPHGWFTCYAPAAPLSGPAVTPTFAGTTFMPYSDYGAETASPIMKEIVKKQFNVQG